MARCSLVALLMASLSEAGASAVLREPDGRWASGQELLDKGLAVASTVDPGAPVVVEAVPSLATVAGILGALFAGATVTPISPTSPAGPRARVAELTGTAQVLDQAALQQRMATTALDEARPAGQLCITTSGTTGLPKGVLLSDAALGASAQSVGDAWAITRDDQLAHLLPLTHVHGLVIGLLGVLARGGAVALLEHPTPEAVAEVRNALGSTMLFGVPTTYHRLWKAGQLANLGALRLCVSGSAPLPSSVLEAARIAGVELLERYGMTETCLTLSNPLDGPRRPGTVGLPLPGVEVRVDAANQLLVATPSMFSGYLGADASAPRPDAEGWFATGDLVEVDDDGYFSIVGRLRDLIITGGYNVVPRRVEEALRQHPSVEDVVVIGRPSTEFGEVVEAVIEGDATSESELRALASAELLHYERPRVYRYVEALPRTELGKVIRSALLS